MFENGINFGGVILSSISLDGGITDVSSIVMELLSYISTNKYHTVIFISNCVFLLICFIFRFITYCKVADIDKSTEEGKKLSSRYNSYIFSHISISAIFSFIVCCTLVMLVNSYANIIWNLVTAPLIGFISSIWFDNHVLANYEDKYKILKNPLNESDKKSDDKKKDKSESGNQNNINININSGEADKNKNEEKFVLEEDKNLSDDQKIEVTINRIIDVQKEQSIILERHSKELNEQNQMLKCMQSLMKNNIKFELEDLIYECLNKGYATPAEDKRIRVKYADYRANKGNGDIKELYETRYLELPIHDAKSKLF